MKPRDSCSEPDSLLVADTSVIINLIASRYTDAILEVLPNRMAVLEEVQLELERGSKMGHGTADDFEELVSVNCLKVGST